MIQGLQPKGTLPLIFGAYHTIITGGPFDFAEHLDDSHGIDWYTVKLASEIKKPCDLDFPIRDFSIPTAENAESALKTVMSQIADGRTIYAGCMAGQGRTGLFLALLTKVSQDYAYRYEAGGIWRDNDLSGEPVAFVRRHYYSHAVETAEQAAFVAGFDTSAVTAYLHDIQPAPAVAPVSALRRFARAALRFLRALVGPSPNKRA